MNAAPAAHDDAELARARDLILRCGWNATAYQLLNPGFTRWFTARGDALVGYVEAAGTRVAGGAPVCPPDRLRAAALDFEAATHDAGKRVCWLGAGGRLAAELDPGTHARVRIGALPWWYPGDWDGTITSHASLRAQLNRARNKGVVVTEWSSQHAAGSADLEACLHRWLDMHGLPPLHFLVEPHLLNAPLDRRFFVAERNRKVAAYLVLTPIPARGGWLAEQIVRGPDAPNGSTELLVNAAVRAVALEGSEYFTLGVAPLSPRAGPSDGPPWFRALVAWTRAHARRFYNFGGLDAFKAKFRPSGWEPAWLVTDAPVLKPHDLWSIAAAYSGGSPAGTLARALARALAAERRRLARRLAS